MQFHYRVNNNNSGGKYMKSLICEKCGSNDFLEQNGYRMCKYCNTKYILDAYDIKPKSSSISLNNDIKMLLQKCRDEPANARRYANLILDIDPDNEEAKRYFK